MPTNGPQLKDPRVASTEPHLPAFSGVTWFQYLVKVDGVLPLMVLPRNLLLPLAICAVTCAGSIASATSESAAANSCARIVRSVFMGSPLLGVSVWISLPKNIYRYHDRLATPPRKRPWERQAAVRKSLARLIQPVRQ